MNFSVGFGEFEEWFLFCVGFLFLSFFASFESLHTSLPVLPFLPFNIISLLAITRGYQLMSSHSKVGSKAGAQVRELRLLDKALIVLNVFGLFVFIVVANYFLHWMVV